MLMKCTMHHAYETCVNWNPLDTCIGALIRIIIYDKLTNCMYNKIVNCIHN